MAEQSTQSKAGSSVAVKKPVPSKGLNQSEDVLMAMNLYAEARSESDKGKYAVANVVRNRVNATTYGWPNTFSGVILQKGQFSWTNSLSDSNTQSALYAKEESAYNSCYRIGYEVLHGGGSNPIGGCDHYCTNGVVASGKTSWAKKENVVKVIGNHAFFNFTSSDDAKALSEDASKNAKVASVTSTTTGGTSSKTSSTGTSTLTAAQVSAAVSYNKKNNAAIAKDIQRTVGLSGSDVDGIFGPQTVKAIAVWQAANGLEADGCWGPKSKAKAASGAGNQNAQQTTQTTKTQETKKTTAPSKSESTVASSGLTSAQITAAISYNKKANASIAKDIQRTVGLTGSDVDGVFGPQTVKAIAVWQAANGLEPDGCWGPKSKAAAASKNAKPEQPSEVKTETPKPNPSEQKKQEEAENKTNKTEEPKTTGTVPSFTESQISSIKSWYGSQKYTTAFIKSFQSVVGTTADGDVGKNTINAVAAWQAQKGLETDGKFGAGCAAAAGLTIERKKSSGYTYSNGNQIESGYVGKGGLKYLYTQDVAAIETGRKVKEIVDLKTKERFNVSWDACATYHSDCTPYTVADTTIFKHIRNPNVSPDNTSYWANYSNWSWAGREAALKLADGTWVAAGYHQRPHAAIMGGNPGAPFQNQSNTPLTGAEKAANGSQWRMGGHFCVYYGDSPGGTQDCNLAAQRAKDMSL